MRKLNFEFVNNYFEKQGCKLLEGKYTNAITNMKYICSCGEISEACWNNFKRGTRCQRCGRQKQAKQ